MRIESGNHIIGVDGGGSTCRVAIARADGTVIAVANGGAANPSTSLDGTIATLRDTLEQARAAAGLTQADLAASRAFIGLAGAISEPIRASIAGALPFADVQVDDDRPGNMVGALGGKDGHIAAIGTGSFVGVQRGETRKFTGGWGFQLGDEASGAWLGRNLLAMVLRWQDGLDPGSDLLAETLTEFGTPGDIVRFAGPAGAADFAKLAPSIVAGAKADDAAALTLIARGVTYIQTALIALDYAPGGLLCLTGGLGPHYRSFLGPEFTDRLIDPKGSVLDGVLALAAEQRRATCL